MASPSAKTRRGPLFTELRWFIALRWMAGLAVVAGGLLEWLVLGWFGYGPVLAGVGLAILAYNAVLWGILSRPPEAARRGWSLRTLSWVQILLDLGCLTVLTLLTGGLHSPLLHFFYLHMVFASILLPRFMAFGGASVAMVLLAGGLWAAGHWPQNRGDKTIFVGWLVMLLLVVELTSHISRSLRRHRRRLVRQNRHIRAMTRRLRRHQKALVQHEKMAAMGQMAAGVAHEIANPLASMDSLLQLMQRKPDRLKAESLTTLRELVDRIHQIIQQMTNFAHPAESEWRTAPLNEVVAQAVRMARMDKRLKRVKVAEEYSPAVGEMPMLPQAIQQVIVNLVVNAADAMAEVVEPVLTVRTQSAGDWAVVDVIDNGHGIRPEHLNRLFEPFFTTKPVGRGTGLGLSISYSLMRKQGGTLSARSEVGKGATFTARLPAGTARGSRNREGTGGEVAVSENPRG